jgi:hypothetical protein
LVMEGMSRTIAAADLNDRHQPAADGADLRL